MIYVKKIASILLFIIALLFSIVICVAIGEYIKEPSREAPVNVDTVKSFKIEEPSFLAQTPKEGLLDALVYYEVKHPDIVYAQALLETGHFTSPLCVKHNNLFGLYNSSKENYYRFNHWAESVEAYIKFVQYKYKPPDDYYEFLDRIGYAEDSTYIEKLKIIVNKIQNDKRRYTERDTISPR